MKILFLSCWYPSDKQPHKGLFIREHARAIQDENHELVVVALHLLDSKSLFKYCQKTVVDQGIVTHHLEIHSFLHKKINAITPFLSFITRRYIKKRILPTFKPDVIHSNVINPAGIIGWQLSKDIQTKHMITEHWSKSDIFLTKNLWASQGTKAYQQAIAITTVSLFLKQKIAPFVDSKEKIEIVPNIIDQETYSFVAKTKQVKIVFMAIATWERPKLPHLFVGALEAIASRNNIEFELHLFGDGSLLREIKQKKHSYNIVYRGYCNKKEIATQFHQSDFFLHASAIETFSIVVAEALSTGTPVIASNVGAIPDLISTKDYGILCENTLSNWENGIEMALKTSYNHKQISEAVTQKYSKISIAKKFHTIYRTLK